MLEGDALLPQKKRINMDHFIVVSETAFDSINKKYKIRIIGLSYFDKGTNSIYEKVSGYAVAQNGMLGIDRMYVTNMSAYSNIIKYLPNITNNTDRKGMEALGSLTNGLKLTIIFDEKVTLSNQ